MPSLISHEFIVTAKIDQWFLILLHRYLDRYRENMVWTFLIAEYLAGWGKAENRIFSLYDLLALILYYTITRHYKQHKNYFHRSICEESMSNIAIADTIRNIIGLLIECFFLCIMKFSIFSCHYYEHFHSNKSNLINLVSYVTIFHD